MRCTNVELEDIWNKMIKIAVLRCIVLKNDKMWANISKISYEFIDLICNPLFTLKLNNSGMQINFLWHALKNRKYMLKCFCVLYVNIILKIILKVEFKCSYNH